MKLGVDFSGVERLRQWIATNSVQIIRRNTIRHFQLLADETAEVVRNRIPLRASSTHAKNEVKSKVEVSGWEVTGLVYGNTDAISVKKWGGLESGRAPGWVPIEPLKAWAQAVFGDPDVAYAVRQVIRKRGTRPKEAFYTGYVSLQQKLVATGEAAATSISQEFGTGFIRFGA